MRDAWEDGSKEGSDYRFNKHIVSVGTNLSGRVRLPHFPWTLSGEPLRAQPLLDPEATALNPFNPQLIKTPWEYR